MLGFSILPDCASAGCVPDRPPRTMLPVTAMPARSESTVTASFGAGGMGKLLGIDGSCCVENLGGERIDDFGAVRGPDRVGIEDAAEQPFESGDAVRIPHDPWGDRQRKDASAATFGGLG